MCCIAGLFIRGFWKERKKERRVVTSRQLGGLAIGIALLSCGGLGYVILTQSPTSLTKALFFPLLFLAVASVIIPCLVWLRRRLGQEDEPGVVLRQGAWAGLYVSLCAGLQVARLLDAIVALVLAAIFQRPERIRRLWYNRTARSHKSRSGKKKR
jgi:hypothetical protein